MYIINDNQLLEVYKNVTITVGNVPIHLTN